MKITIPLIIGIFSALAFTSCRKQHDVITISGKIVDPNQGINVEDALVELWAQKIESGIYSAHYDQQGSQLTNNDGEFLFELDNKTYASVKLTFSKDNYYGWEYEIDGDVIKSDYLHNETYQLQPKAWIEISVKNINPFDNKDYFDFRIMNGYTDCELCCNGELQKFTGMDINESILCQMIGHLDVSILWNVNKESVQSGDVDLIFLPAFDTTHIDYHY